MDQLLDSEAVGQLLGIQAATVRRYLYESTGTGRRYSNNPFPPPDGTIGRSSYWLAKRKKEILDWDKRRKKGT